MDVEKQIKAAEWCKNGPDFPNLPCGGCPVRRDDHECMEFNDLRRSAEGILTIRDYYEEKLMLLREDIKLQRAVLTQHKDVIEDYKSRLAAERAAVIAELRDKIELLETIVALNWNAETGERFDDWETGYWAMYNNLVSIVDSMEPDKEESK